MWAFDYNKRAVWMHRHMEWFPIQFCMVCGKLFWAELPRFERTYVSIDSADHRNWIVGKNCKKKWVVLWLPGWNDYCSRKCCDEDKP